MNNYIVIKNISVHNYHTLNGFFTCGLPSMTAYAGFIHSIQREIRDFLLEKNIPKEEAESIRFDLFSVFIHEFQHYEGVEKFVTYQKDLPHDKVSPIIERPLGAINFSLICEISDNEKVEELMTKMLVEDLTLELRKVIFSKKFLGGHISSFDLDFYSLQDLRSVIIKSKFKNGYFITKPSSINIEEYNLNFENFVSYFEHIKKENQFNHLEAFTSLFSKVKEKQTYEKMDKLWLLPMSIGYQGILKIDRGNKQLRKNQDGMIAEPILGLLRLRSIGSVLAGMRQEEKIKMLWGYDYSLKDKSIFIVNAK